MLVRLGKIRKLIWVRLVYFSFLFNIQYYIHYSSQTSINNMLRQAKIRISSASSSLALPYSL